MDRYFLRKIKIEDQSHLFLCRGSSRIVDSGKLEHAFLFKRQLYANLYKVDGYILKVCYGQSIPKDILRKYALKSQAEREAQSAAILSSLGLIAPKSYFSAFSIFPLTRGWAESMHEMDFLDGYEDLTNQFAQRDDSLKIIACFGRDLAVITNAMFCPKDLGIGNVMYHKSGDKLAWIDTDLKKNKDKEALSQRVVAQLLPRFLKYLDNHQSEIFWTAFCDGSDLFKTKDELLSGGGI